jgi:hypothetical protein
MKDFRLRVRGEIGTEDPRNSACEKLASMLDVFQSVLDTPDKRFSLLFWEPAGVPAKIATNLLASRVLISPNAFPAGFAYFEYFHADGMR